MAGRHTMASWESPGRLVLGAGLLAAFTIWWAPGLSYDAWSWVGWGREVLQGALDTNGGASFKPLPVLICAPLSLLGSAAPLAWLIIARTGAIAAVVLAYSVVRALGGGRAGAATAAGALVLVSGWLELGSLGWSEGLQAALALGAVLAHRSERHGRALWLGFACGLTRPEAWPFWYAYAGWTAWRMPVHRRLAVGLGLALPALWIGPELWGSGQPLRAATRARQGIPSAGSLGLKPAREVIELTRRLIPLPIKVGAVAAVALAAVQRDRTVLALGAAALAWVALVAILAQRGYPATPRFLVLAAALACVLTGLAVERLLALAGHGRRRLVAALALGLVATPFALGRRAELRHELDNTRYHARLGRQLDRAVSASGGADAVRSCGNPVVNPFEVPHLAWLLDRSTAAVADSPTSPGATFRAQAWPGAPELPAAGPPKAGARTFRVGGWTVVLACRASASPA